MAETLNELLEGLSIRNDDSMAKWKIREEVWNKMESDNLNVLFKNHNPNNPKRIPYFKGCQIAAKKAVNLAEIRGASVIKVNPSLAQMHFRYLVLKRGKKLIVPMPSLTEKESFLLVDGANLSPKEATRAQTKSGSLEHGTRLDLINDKSLHIDAVVVGSVAVAKNGVRLGKGLGLAELEWGLLWSLDIVTEETIVITTVHEAQIIPGNRLHPGLMADHDLPVDIIVTPKRIINVKHPLKKPNQGIIWDLVTEKMMKEMPVLKELYDQK